MSPISYYFDELHTLPTSLNIDFSILGITETGLITGKKPLKNIDLEGYAIESTTIETSWEAALLYINENINYKTRNDLNIYKSKELESIFIEKIDKRRQKYNHIYQHLCMEPKEFNDTFMQVVIEKLSFIVLI